MVSRRFFEVVDSTQLLAVQLARAGEPVGTRVVAERQSAGRGRMGHSWISPAGGLYLSVIGPDVSEAGALTSLALAAGLHELLHLRYSVRTEVKWPNDLVCLGPGGPRKLAGILPERVEGSAGPRTVVGLGLNVSTALEEFPPEFRGRIARIADFRAVPPLDELEERVAGQFLTVLEELASPTGRAHWLAVGRRVLFGRGRLAVVDGVRLGAIQELGEDGTLWVLGREGPMPVRTGTLTVEEIT